MADEPNKSGSWWATMPGLLTAGAAVITAVTGLIAVLAQNGIFGDKGRLSSAATASSTQASSPSPSPVPRTAAVPATPRIRTTASDTPSGSDATPSGGNPSRAAGHVAAIEKATAAAADQPYRAVRVVMRDGTTVEVGDDFVVASSKRFELKNGQAIDFSRIVTIDVTDVIDAYHPAIAHITLVGGARIEALFDPYWDLKGRNQLGPFNTRWPQVRSVEFVR